jgi:hypothetical protein
MEVCRKELQRLCDIGVLKRCGPLEWGLIIHYSKERWEGAMVVGPSRAEQSY